jgi:hypothetical protein
MARSSRQHLRAAWYVAFAFVLVSQTYAQTPAEAMAQAESKLAAHDLNGAWETLHSAVERNPEAPELSGALGFTDYLRGEIADAEMEFKKAIRLNDKFARAWLGLGRVFEAGSMRAKAKICYQKAWKENPGDPEAQRYYARTLGPAARLAALESYDSAVDSETRDSIRRQVEELKWTGNRKLYAVSPIDHAEIKLSWLMFDAKRIRGFALPVSINGGKEHHLVMDTGAGGILLNRKAAAADEAWQDRETAPELAGYSSFWHVGHDILLPVRVNNSRPVLFLIDTGSSTSLIDPVYARQFTGLRSEERVSVKGVSGKVNTVQSSGLLTFEFGHYRQRVPGVLAVPLTKLERDSRGLPAFSGSLLCPTSGCGLIIATG